MIGSHMPTTYPEIQDAALRALTGPERTSTLAHARDALKQALDAEEGGKVEAYNVFARNFITQLKCAAGVDRIVSVRGLSYAVNEEVFVAAARLMLSSGPGDSAYARTVAQELLAALEGTLKDPNVVAATPETRKAAVRLLADAFGPLTFGSRLPIRIRDDIDDEIEEQQPIGADEEAAEQIGRLRKSPRGGRRYRKEFASELIALLLVAARVTGDSAMPDDVAREIGVMVGVRDPALARAATDAIYAFHGNVKIATPARKNITLEQYMAASRALLPALRSQLALQFGFLFVGARKKLARGRVDALTKKFRFLFKRTAERLSRIVDYGGGVAQSVAAFLIKVLDKVAGGGHAIAAMQAYESSAIQSGMLAALGAELERASAADTTLEEQQIGHEAVQIGDDEQQQIDASLFSRAKEAVTGRIAGKRYRITTMADEVVKIFATIFASTSPKVPDADSAVQSFSTNYVPALASEFKRQLAEIQVSPTYIKQAVDIMATSLLRVRVPSVSEKRIDVAQFALKAKRTMSVSWLAKEFANVVVYYAGGARVSPVAGAAQSEQQKRQRDIESDMQSLYRKVVREVQRVSGVGDIRAQEMVGRALIALFSAFSDTPYVYTAPTRRSASPLRRLSPTRWFRRSSSDG